ncbi:MAG: 3-phosphoglycerate dehydrogenase [Phycisphaerales bacterium]
MKILVADKFEKSGLEGLAALGCEVFSEPTLGVDGIPGALERLRPDALIVRSTKVPSATIAKADSIRLIVRAGSGVDNIDVGAATARGIKVCNCPGMNAVAVAELTLGLLLCCDRRIPDQVAVMRGGVWNKKEFGRTGAGGSRGLKGSTLGVVGVGAIGQEVIRRAVAFGMRVIAWSRGITPQHASALNCEFGGNDTPALLSLARQCDAISVHLPLVDSTKKLFGAEFFGAMKPGATFVNTSRAGIVDEAALRAAIVEKKLRCGLDVLDGQPGDPEAPFANETVKLPGVYCTHHCGASTDQAQNAVADEAVRIVKVFRESGRAENCVNP